MLEKPINIVSGNDFFEAKRLQYRKSKNYLTSSLAEIHTVGVNTSITRINEKLKSFENWNAESIDVGHSVLSLASDNWKTFEIDHSA
jgi:hypothetical protein